MTLKTGDKIKRPYPFKFMKYREDFGFGEENMDCWQAGCNMTLEDGPEIYEGQCHQYPEFWADAEGEIELEILAIVELGGKLSDRAVIRKTYYYPDGKVRKFCPEMITVSLLEKRLSTRAPFKVDYEVYPSKEAIEALSN